MNVSLAYLLQLAAREASPSLFPDGATLLLCAPPRDVSTARGVYGCDAGDMPLLGGAPPAGAWEIKDGALSYEMPIEYACGWRYDKNEADRHVQQYLSLPSALFPDGDFTLTFTAALPGMGYADSGHYIKSYGEESENWSYLLQTPNFSVYTKHKCKTAELTKNKKIPVTAFYNFYNDTGLWNNPANECRLTVEGQSFFERLFEPCTYLYSRRDLQNGNAELRVLICGPAGELLWEAKKEIALPQSRGDRFRFALDVPVRLYGFALYPRVLSTEEEVQVRLAVLFDRHGLDIRRMTALPQDVRARVCSALLSTVSLADEKEAAEEKFEAALAAEGERL